MAWRGLAWGALLTLAACDAPSPAAPVDAAFVAMSSPVASDDAAPPEDAGAVLAVDGAASAPSPYGKARVADAGLCGALGRPGGMFIQFVGRRDLTTSFVDGDDLLAIVNRSPLGTLAPDYAPSDLVDLMGGQAITAKACDGRHACLRKDAAGALHDLLRAWAKHGQVGRVESAYRSYTSQCGVFIDWTEKAHKEKTPITAEDLDFCGASEQSALAGHSQHQLGTTVDLFTEDWFKAGEDKHEGSFRSGFGCTSAGLWLAENAWTYGFVLPYPIHPDDRHPKQPCLARWDVRVPPNPRTGYQNEPWHLRFIGKENAAAFHEAALREDLTLETWLRRRAGLPGDADLPVCDGCACGACATLAPGDGTDGGTRAAPCGDRSLWLNAQGLPVSPVSAPTLEEAHAGLASKDGATLVVVRVSSPPHSVTQPPVLTAKGPILAAGSTFESLVPYPGVAPHRFPDLPGAWRIAVEVPGSTVRWPWRASLASDGAARVYNRANLYLPAEPGARAHGLQVILPAGTQSIRVTLLHDGQEHDTRELSLP